MNEQTLYHGYDRAGLDAQYDNRSRHPEHVEIGEARARESAKARETLKGALDIPFGPSEAEVLDVFMPDDAVPGGAPVNVFLHGGYWYSRHKDDFSFMARGVVPAGGISVIVNYALVPDVDLDELVRQCRAAVAWTHANIAEYGGDPDRVFVSGHSAGGHLVAMMAATDWPAFGEGLPKDPVKGGVAISGLFDLTPMLDCFLSETLGFTEDQARRSSPILMAPPATPLIVAVGGDETQEFIRQSADFVKVWKAGGADVEYLLVPGTNHFTVLAGAADPDDLLGGAILRQMGLDAAHPSQEGA